MNCNTEIYINEKRKARSKNIYDVIQRYANRDITSTEAAELLNFHVKYIPTLKKKLEINNDLCFIHQSYGTKYNSKISKDIEDRIISIYTEKAKILHENNSEPLNYKHFKDTFNREQINIDENFKLSISSIAKVLVKNKKYSPKCHTKSKHKDQVAHKSETVYKCGEVTEMDGSFNHQFIDDSFECCLVAFVDRATATFVGAYFDIGETNAAYIQCMKQSIESYGVAKKYMGDNRAGNQQFRNETKRNIVLGNGINQMGSILDTSSNPNDKPVVEVMNKTVRDRLKKELILSGARTMDEANILLPKVLQIINADLKNEIQEPNMYLEPPKDFVFENAFGKSRDYKINKRYNLSIGGEEYMLVKDNMAYRLTKGDSVQVIKRTDNILEAHYKNTKFELILSNRENRRKYHNDTIFSVSKNIRIDGTTFTYLKEQYHIISVTNDPVFFKPKTNVVIHYKEINKIEYISVNNIKYNFALGAHNKIKNEVPIQTVINCKFTYNGTIKTDNKNYFIVASDGKQLMPGEYSTVQIYKLNGKITHAMYNDEIFNVLPVKDNQYLYQLPTSKYAAIKYFSQKKDLYTLHA